MHFIRGLSVSLWNQKAYYGAEKDKWPFDRSFHSKVESHLESEGRSRKNRPVMTIFYERVLLSMGIFQANGPREEKVPEG